jgi:hypothetical protein
MKLINIKKLSKKQLKKLMHKNKLRSDFEVWLDFHNHKMELIRTISSFTGFIISICIAAKVFGFLD